MTRQSSREKVKRHRLRQVGKLPALPTCQACGRTVLGIRTLPLCFLCWLVTDAGRAAEAERKRRERARRKGNRL